MSIYSSEKVLPYVYQCIHKTTGKIYIGSRTTKNQKLPSHLDFPKYRTSSKIVKPIFDEFYWHIVAEFFNPKDAYDFEQQLIYEQWLVSKEMSLNGFHQYEKPSWNVIGIKRSFSEEHKLKIGISNKGKSKPQTKEHKFNRARSRSKKYNFLTPDGFVIENITMRELCSQFNLVYKTLYANFRNNKPHNGFIRISIT